MLFHLVDQPLLTDSWLLISPFFLEASHSPVNPDIIAAPSLDSVAPSLSAAAENTAAASAQSTFFVAGSGAGLQVLMLAMMAGQSLTGVE
jgi:hypothetical protein